jgi:hypothetical protein
VNRRFSHELVWFVGLLALSAVTVFAPYLLAADAPRVELNTASASPREVEEGTHKALLRDYSNTWKVLTRALAENRDDLLGEVLVGIARDKFTELIRSQKAAGIRSRYLDRGHKVEAVFYSTEGSSVQLRDTAQFRIEVLDGNNVIHTEDVTLRYIALLTMGEGTWKTRILETVEKF